MTDFDTTFETHGDESRLASPRMIERLARGVVLKRLKGLEVGELTVIDSCSDSPARHVFGQSAGEDSLCVTVHVRDPRFYSEIALGGALGAGEAFIQGFWHCDDLTALVRLLVRNRRVLDDMEHGMAWITKPMAKLLHRINRNTRAGSRKNISAHYDLGNEFFGLWLDETMMYSSAIFASPEATLHDASVAKLERICQKLQLGADDHVLEIGTGWGGFAIYAASTRGCRVTTTTISREQFEFARQRVLDAGLEDRITLLFEDYRDLDGQYDKLVSIEMIEAVGHEYLDTYFEKCASLLKPEGMMMLQAITIADQRYRKALKSVDFIQRYIFPGGFLPSVTAMLSSITNSTDMRVFHLEDIGAHYARTLRCWRSNFRNKIKKVRALGYNSSFLRMWEYYYCYCEGAFTERAIGNVQMLLVRPGNRRDPV